MRDRIFLKISKSNYAREKLMDKDIVSAALLLENEATRAQGDLAKYLSSTDLYASCYAFKHRVKKRKKLAEKVQRKLEFCSDYNIWKITDVVGLRLVTLFKRDMPDVLEALLESILSVKSDGLNPFKEDSIKEVIIFSTNPTHDSLIPRMKALFEKLGVNDFEIKDSATYSSVHIVAQLSNSVDCSEVSDIKEMHHIPIEIQIRTVYEDAWGEIDHKYGYVVREGKDSGFQVKNIEYVLGHLKVLKKFSDACVDYADLISREAHDDIEKINPTGKVITIDTNVDSFESNFLALGVGKNIIDEFFNIRESKLQTFSKAYNSLDRSVITELLSCADQYKQLFLKIDENEGDGYHLLSYFVQMNEALCLLSTREKNNILIANKIYERLKDTYSEFPLVYFRWGQSLGKLGSIELSHECFKKTKEIMSKIDVENFETEGWPIELPKEDYEHISKRVDKFLGYSYWELSDKSTQVDVKKENLEKAISATELALCNDLVSDKDKTSLINNITYFKLDLVELQPSLSKNNKFKKDILNNLDILESSINFESDNMNMKHLDTIANAYHFCGEQQKALDIGSIAEKIALKLDEGMYNNAERLLVLKNVNKIRNS